MAGIEPSTSVSITGADCVTCAGLDLPATWKTLRSGNIGIVSGKGEISVETLRRYVGKLSLSSRWRKDFVALAEDLPRTKFPLLALLAIRYAMNQAGWDTLDSSDGLILATTTGCISVWEPLFLNLVTSNQEKPANPEMLQSLPLNTSLACLTRFLSFEGPSILVTSACSASSQGLLLGRAWLQEEKVRRCLIVGAEVLSDLTLAGFSSLQLTTDHPAKPFDRNRKGINLGEGAAAVCLERDRNNRTRALVSGGGITSDAYHMTSPDPKGLGCERAIRLALQDAQLPPEKIDWIHAHGTGSAHNDRAESASVHRMFEPNPPWISSTKGSHGHLLGATGLVEMVICVEAMKQNCILPTIGLEDPDPELIVRHPTTTLSQPIEHILKTTLGFGGTNTAVILSRADGATG